MKRFYTLFPVLLIAGLFANEANAQFWKKDYHTIMHYSENIIGLTNGNYLFSHINNLGVGGVEIGLTRIDTFGNSLWNRNYSKNEIFGVDVQPSDTISVYRIFQSQDGHYVGIFAQTTMSANQNHNRIVKFNSQTGDTIWSKKIDADIPFWSPNDAVLQLSTGEFLVLENNPGSINFIFLMHRLDANGNQGFVDTIQKGTDDIAYAVKEDPNGNFIVGLRNTSTFPAGLQLMKINNYTILWSKNIYGGYFFENIIPTSDGGYLISPLPNNPQNPYLHTKYNANGDSLYSFPANNQEMLVELNGGGYMGIGGPWNNREIRKLDTQGNMLYSITAGHFNAMRIILNAGNGITAISGNSMVIRTDALGYFCDNPGCVWPGDADNDGIANNTDLLQIGLAYGFTGNSRPLASSNWQGQFAADWVDTFSTGLNVKFADTNGDGVIDNFDIPVITMNYGMTHQKTSFSGGSNHHAPLYVAFPTDSASVGDTIHAGVFLGVDTLQAIDVYGLAFTIHYDSSLISPNSLSIDYSSSWLGTPGTQTIHLTKDFPSAGQVDVAVSRIIHTNQSGFGQIGTLSFVLEDNIDGKTSLVSKPLELSISNVKAISYDESTIQVNPKTTSIIITQQEIGILNPHGIEIKIYPNPANDKLNFEFNNASIEEIALIDITGRELRKFSNPENRAEMDVAGLAPGIYFISVSQQDWKIVKKIIISR